MNRLCTALLIAAILCVCPVAAQDQPKPTRPEIVQKVIEPKYLSNERAERAFHLLNSINTTDVKIAWDRFLNTLVLSGSAGHVAELEALFQRLDVPEAKPKQIELTIYLVAASPDASRNGPVPPDLDSVIKEMKSAFIYKGFRLLDTIVMQASNSRGELSGVMPKEVTGTDLTSFYHINFLHAETEDKVINISNFSFSVKIPVTNRGSVVTESSGGNILYGNTGVSTDLTMREGQKLVVGKIKTDQSDNALFLVVSGKIE